MSLERCPFCASADVEMEIDITEAWVTCTDCLASGPLATIGCRDVDEEPVNLQAEAEQMWNQRRSARLVAEIVLSEDGEEPQP
jgi:hypothetical protein